MASPSDHELGQRLGDLIQQTGDKAFEAGVLSRRLQAQLQDLLGADTTLLSPLRDLLQRPAFRQLFNVGSQGQIPHARDALLRDLAEVYSSAVLNRLDAVLQGCLNLPVSATRWPAAAGSAPPPVGSASTAPAPTQVAPPMAGPMVVTIPAPRQQGATAILIALLALICGALVMALAGVLITSRSNTGTPAAAPAPSPANPAAPAPAVPEPAAPEPVPDAQPTAGQWQACVDYPGHDGPAPQSGETWWPVVGPAEALDASHQYCRGDAFINASGNVQIASFRNRDTAAAFAQQLTTDDSHPYTFWVGDPTVR